MGKIPASAATAAPVVRVRTIPAAIAVSDARRGDLELFRFMCFCLSAFAGITPAVLVLVLSARSGGPRLTHFFAGNATDRTL